MSKFFIVFLVILSLFVVVAPAEAQEEPVVYAVLFYSPSCSHCHTLIEQDLPAIQAEFGDQLEVLFVNVSQPNGSAMFSSACQALNVPNDRCGAVPTMVVDQTIMVGGYEIPTQLPALVRNGLASGGLGLPPIPGLPEAYEAAFGEAATSPSESVISQSAVSEPSWSERFEDDLAGNSLAIVVLVMLVGSLGYVGWQKQGQWLAAVGVAVLALLVAGSLLTAGDAMVVLIALSIAGVLILTIGIIWDTQRQKQNLPNWLFPLIALAGIAVAGYMLYIETGSNDAVCGAVGNCNLVQQSEYAELFGILPIGLLGIVGYAAILLTWWLAQRVDDPENMQSTLFGLTLFGTAFSIYLTFLEPFVIGATCAWCLTSALLMLLLLWLQAPLKTVRR